MARETGIAAPVRHAEMHSEVVEVRAWDALAAMTTLKGIIERRVILPLNEPSRAQKHGLAPPVAALLFGPPGTGKTVLARAVAGRLGWLFVDADLSTVSLEATRLHQLFERLFRLEQAVIFLDEFDYLGRKRGEQNGQSDALTAELLRQMSAIQSKGNILIVCATNYIGLLDPALLRPGRFDLVLPVGLPNQNERAALLRSFLARHHCGPVQLDLLASESDGLTPSDLESVCRRAAQRAFEQEVETGQDSPIETATVLSALRQHRPTLNAEDLEAFRADAARLARY